MNNIDLLILHGPPGAGKSTLAKAIATHLKKDKLRHVVIELDDLANIYPLSLKGIMYKNLAAIWPNYVGLGDIKIIIPTYLQLNELEIIKNIAPAKNFSVCEITAPKLELQRRITEREPSEDLRKRLLGYIDDFAVNSPEDKFINFKISNHNKNAENIAFEIIQKSNWNPQNK
jgi:predicted kinase